MRDHLETFLTRLEGEHAGRRLPSYVERQLRAFLACGDPTRGFCRTHCPSSASDLLLPFSCKGWGAIALSVVRRVDWEPEIPYEEPSLSGRLVDLPASNTELQLAPTGASLIVRTGEPKRRS